MRDTVNEGSTAWVPVVFNDRTGTPSAPTSATYRIDCLTTGEVVLEDTALPAGAEVEIELTPADNAIIDPANRTERRQITVEALFGAGQAHNQVFLYEVVNLSAVP